MGKGSRHSGFCEVSSTVLGDLQFVLILKCYTTEWKWICTFGFVYVTDNANSPP